MPTNLKNPIKLFFDWAELTIQAESASSIPSQKDEVSARSARLLLVILFLITKNGPGKKKLNTKKKLWSLYLSHWFEKKAFTEDTS